MTARRIAGFVIAAASGVVIAVSAFVVFGGKFGGNWRVVIPGAIGLGAGIALARLGRRLRAPSAEELLARDGRAPVVYLRSFTADQAAARSPSDSFVRWILPNPFTAMLDATEEEQLERVLAAHGPVIALGRPSELLPRVGAAREYVPDAEWQATVARWVEKAALVVIRAGDTPGVRWELGFCVERVRPDALIVLTPRKEREYEAFRTWAEPVLRCTLPPFAGGTDASFGSVLAFDRDRSARLVPVKTTFGHSGLDNPVGRAFGTALRAARPQQPDPWTDAGWGRRLAAAALDFVLPVALAVAMKVVLEGLGVRATHGVLETLGIVAAAWGFASFLFLVPFTEQGTLGQRAMGIRVVDRDIGCRPGAMQTVVRALLMFVQSAPLPLLGLLALVRVGPFIPDRFARTRVVMRRVDGP